MTEAVQDPDPVQVEAKPNGFKHIYLSSTVEYLPAPSVAFTRSLYVIPV